MTKKVLILGGSSDVGTALAQQMCDQGDDVTVTVRSENSLKGLEGKLDLTRVKSALFDVERIDTHEAFYQQLQERPDIVICTIGYLGDQKAGQVSISEMEKLMQVNFLGAVSILGVVANDFEKRGHGTIVGISSVAGERGRASNYLYGSAKAGFTAFLSGLRNRLQASGVHVMTVKPGFIRSKMIANMQTPEILTSSPAHCAKRIINGIRRKRNTIYVYRTWFWIALILRNIPEAIFKRLSM